MPTSPGNTPYPHPGSAHITLQAVARVELRLSVQDAPSLCSCELLILLFMTPMLTMPPWCTASSVVLDTTTVRSSDSCISMQGAR
eukprot:1161045-Pelagomonas_calceolata.AAC.19